MLGKGKTYTVTIEGIRNTEEEGSNFGFWI
jgi:hypothetical protein